MSVRWSGEIGCLEGKIGIVTGSYGGLGYETVLGLVHQGATVIIAGRNQSKANQAIKKLKEIYPNAHVSFGKVDLGSLTSVTEFCKEFMSKNQALDILVNNAGIMMPRKRETTQEGFEIQMGTNHLGHFALTAQLLPALRKSSQARVVNVSSMAARQGTINFDDIHAEKSYSPWTTYAQSKLANLLFTFELQRKSDLGGWGLMALAAHPGYSKTDLCSNGPGNRSFFGWVNSMLGPFLSQSAANGALPLLFAATSPQAKPCGYYGPQGFTEIKGHIVGNAFVPTAATDTQAAANLWNLSQALTNVQWL